MTNVPRVAYAPYDASLNRPGDRRRFAAYASRRGIPFSIANPKERYDLVIVSEAADISVWDSYPHGRVVFDLIDSYLSIPRTNIKHLLRGTAFYVAGRHKNLRLEYSKNLRSMCRRADAVVCSTPEQAQVIRDYCRNVHIILDVHDMVVGRPKSDYRVAAPLHVVWEGLPAGIHLLREIGPVLKKVDLKYPLRLTVLTDAEGKAFMGQFGRFNCLEIARSVISKAELIPWSEENVARVVPTCDVAVIPIDLSDGFMAGKPENKLLLLWRFGLPVIASATPAYQRALGSVGFLELACRSESEWLRAFDLVIGSEDFRREAGHRGRAVAEDLYSANSLLSRWDMMFRSIGFEFSPRDIGSLAQAECR